MRVINSTEFAAYQDKYAELIDDILIYQHSNTNPHPIEKYGGNMFYAIFRKNKQTPRMCQ